MTSYIGTIGKPFKSKKMGTPFRIIVSNQSKLEKHIDYCEYMVEMCNRKSNKLKPYYFKKQIEVAKRKLVNL